MENKKKFPLKPNIITTIVILLSYILCISVLYAISKNLPENNPTGLILIIVFSSLFLLLIIYFWLREILRFRKANQDE